MKNIYNLKYIFKKPLVFLMCGLLLTEEELKMEASLQDLFKGSEPPPPNISIFICAAMLLCMSFKLVAIDQVSSALPQVYFSDPLLKFYVDEKSKN